MDIRRFEFATHRLQLRPLIAADAALFKALYMDAQTMRFIGPPLGAQRAARSFRKYMQSAPCAQRQLLLTIIEKAGAHASASVIDPVIGICAIQQLDERRRRAEAGIMMHPAAQSRGFAKEALAALVAQAFAVLPLDEIWMQAAADHAVVERLILGVGFARRGDEAGGNTPARITWSAYRDTWTRQATH